LREGSASYKQFEVYVRVYSWGVKRTQSYGESQELSILDKVGQILSNRNIRRALNSVDTKNSLGDIGSGFSANITRSFWPIFAEIHLFDLSLDRKNLNSFPSNFVFHEGDVMDTTAQVGVKLDFIVMNNLLEHVDDPIQLLAQVKKILSSGGILFINVPSWKGKFFLEKAAFVFNLAPREEMEDHKRYYSKRELWLEIRQAGFLPSKIFVKKSKFGLNVSAIVKNE
jgi:SAM-dependent methyltransferase